MSRKHKNGTSAQAGVSRPKQMFSRNDAANMRLERIARNRVHYGSSAVHEYDLQYFMNNPDVYKKLVKSNRQRMRRLSKMFSNPENASAALRQYRKDIAAAKTKEAKMTAELLYATAKTATVKGSISYNKTKRTNMINKIDEYADLSEPDRKTLRKYLELLPDDEFNEVAGAWYSELQKSGTLDSGQMFKAIAADIVHKAKVYKNNKTTALMEQAKNRIAREEQKIQDAIKTVNPKASDFNISMVKGTGTLRKVLSDYVEGNRTDFMIDQRRHSKKATFNLNDLLKIPR